MADRLKSVQEVGMGSGKNNAGIESPTSPHVAQRNLEEAAILYTVIKGDETSMSD